jgi:hypothetical protein
LAVQALWQQIPPTQCPFVHWLSAEHVAPSLFFGAQLRVVAPAAIGAQ